MGEGERTLRMSSTSRLRDLKAKIQGQGGLLSIIIIDGQEGSVARFCSFSTKKQS